MDFIQAIKSPSLRGAGRCLRSGEERVNLRVRSEMTGTVYTLGVPCQQVPFWYELQPKSSSNAAKTRVSCGPAWAARQSTPVPGTASVSSRPTYRQRLVKVRLVTKGPGPDHKRMTAPSGTGLLRMV